MSDIPMRQAPAQPVPRERVVIKGSDGQYTMYLTNPLPEALLESLESINTLPLSSFLPVGEGGCQYDMVLSNEELYMATIRGEFKEAGIPCKVLWRD